MARISQLSGERGCIYDGCASRTKICEGFYSQIDTNVFVAEETNAG
ncbi:unnamed protein product [Wuchereria bancrofti]|uniref:Uncharacterized protein n=1 Tax=Wuchereria bancrofti TaxID=6293 RepID=A0A3P7FC88_WUCBA|nr:unnamed protein product [Wuchereria bancrofti]